MPPRALLILLTLMLLVGVACAPVAAGAGPTPARGQSPDQAELYEDAAIFSVAHQLMAGAHARLWLEMYEFGRKDLAADLEAGRARGVDVRVVYDPTVSETRRTIQQLAQSGLVARPYPVDDARHQIDHVKLLLVDGEALVGGMNWGRHSDRNHDYAVAVRAQATVLRLAEVFEQDWSLASAIPRPLPEAAAGMAVQTSPHEEIRAAIEQALAKARRSVRAEVFVLTDATVLAMLGAARKRGVSVRVLLDPRQEVNRAGFLQLRQAGVEVRWYPVPPGAKLHAKIGLFDGKLVVGSANWSFGGLSVNHELDLQLEEPRVARTFSARFEADWAASPA